MAIPVIGILTKVGDVLNDSEFVRWTEGELVRWINDAAAEVVIRRPSAGAVVELMTLVPGVNQSLPNLGIELLDIPATADGYPVRRTDRQLLDDQRPGWRREKASARIKHYAFDDRTSTKFFVYPPAADGAQVEIMYSRAPDSVTSRDDTLDIDLAYLSPIISFVLYRALAKDSEFANGQIAAAHYQAFSEAMGTRNQTAAAVSPNQASV